MKMKIQKIEFEIGAICPMKVDRWLSEKQPKTEDGYKEQATKKVYKDDKGNCAIPTNALKAVIKNSVTDLGKKMESRKNKQTIMSCLFFEKELVTLTDKKGNPIKKPDCIAMDIVTRKGTGDKVTRVPTYRPLIKDWKAKGIIYNYGVDFNMLREAMELGGLRYGLLSHRPEFGRYELLKFVEVKNVKK